jgi:hypothetical protein
VRERSNWPHGHSKTLTPQERSLRGSLASNISWGNTADRSARTQPARDALFAKFCDQVYPNGVLPEDERTRRAESLLKAHMQRMSLAAAKARRMRGQARKDGDVDMAAAEAAAMAAARQERTRVKEDALAAVLTEIIKLPLSDGQRERIAELLGGGGAVQRPLIGDR